MESVYVDNPEGSNLLSENEVPAHMSQLFGKAPHLTLEASRSFLPFTSPAVYPVFPSLRSLTIISDDFPSPESLAGAPLSVEMLVIAFKGCRCRLHPLFADKRVFNFIQSRATKNVRIFINSMAEPSLPGEARPLYCTMSLFSVPDSDLFLKTQALCTQRGG